MNNYEEFKIKKDELLKTPILSAEDFATRIKYFEQILNEFQENESHKFILELMEGSKYTEINKETLKEITGHTYSLSELLNNYSKK